MKLGVLNMLIVLVFSAQVIADKNITIDDADWSRIQYFPPDKWTSVRGAQTSDRYNQTTSFTASHGAYAMFNFSGAVAFYFMGYGILPQGPLGTIAIEFDGQPYEVPESVDPARSAQQILFSKRDLDVNKQYTFIVRKTSPDGGVHDLNVDAMIYTVPDGAGDPGEGGGWVVSAGTIAGGVVGGVGFCTLLLGVWLWLRCKRKKNRIDPRAPAPYILPLHASSSSVQVSDKHALTISAAPVPLPPHSYPAPRSTSANPLPPNVPGPSLPSRHPTESNVALPQSRQFSPPPYSS